MKLQFLLAMLVFILFAASCEITRERPQRREHREARENRHRENQHHNY